MAVELKVQERDNSKKSIIKRLRREGKIPAVVYGKSAGNQNVSVDEGTMIRVFHDQGRNGVINLQLGGQSYSVMAHDIQQDHLRGEIVHIDFLEVDMTSETDAEVPVHTVGESVGEKEGGVLQHSLTDLTVRALPADIPTAIEVDVSELTVGEVLKVKDIKATGNYTIIAEEDDVVVSITTPTQDPEKDDDEADELGTEVIQEKGVQGEE